MPLTQRTRWLGLLLARLQSAQRFTPAGGGLGAAGLLAAWLKAAGSILGVTGAAEPAGMTRVAWSHLAAAGELVHTGWLAGAAAAGAVGLAGAAGILARVPRGAACGLALR